MHTLTLSRFCVQDAPTKHLSHTSERRLVIIMPLRLPLHKISSVQGSNRNFTSEVGFACSMTSPSWYFYTPQKSKPQDDCNCNTYLPNATHSARHRTSQRARYRSPSPVHACLCAVAFSFQIERSAADDTIETHSLCVSLLDKIKLKLW